MESKYANPNGGNPVINNLHPIYWKLSLKKGLQSLF